MRPRIKQNVVVSATGNSSKRTHTRKSLQANHEINSEYLQSVLNKSPKRPYVSVFGKLMPLREDEVQSTIDSGIKVQYL
jgi:hypothetical protein